MADEIVCLTRPDSVYAEAYRTLRTNISMREFDKPVEVINVISANAHEAKTTTAINLAVVYAQLDLRVLLIDLDLRLPSVHKKLSLKNNAGITNVLTSKRPLEKTVIRYKDLFDVLLSGSKMPFTSEFIQSHALRDFILKMRSEYDIIIIDCPPANLVSDGLIASKYCDGTLFCVASGYDEQRDLEEAKTALENVGANVLGVVMTRMPEARNKYYKYGGYGYGHKNSSGKGGRK